LINQGRTLLLNSNVIAAGNAPGEQYVPPEYSAVQLPTYLQAIRSRLFGANPDRAMLNYRLAQYMGILHATPLSVFLTALDPRITYTDETGGVTGELFDAATYYPTLYGPTLLSLLGSPAAPDAQGRMYFSYTLDLASKTVTQQSPQQSVSTFALNGENELTNPIALQGSGYSVNVYLPGAGTSGGVLVPQGLVPGGNFSSPFFGQLIDSPYFGTTWSQLQAAIQDDANFSAVWQIEFFNRPQWDLGQIALLLQNIGEVNENSLFGTTLVEPYKTFANLFFDHPELAYSLGGFLLAVIYRTNELWGGG